MALLKSIAQKIVFPTVAKLGLEKLFSRFSSNNKLVLVYHGVVEQPQHNISVGPIAVKQFEEHLTYFKQNFDVVSLEDIFQMYRSDFKPKRKTLAITFDDGYENNYTRAFPLLRKFGFPATMFIISQSLEDENRLTWYDYVDFVRQDIDFTKIDVNGLSESRLENVADLRKLIKRLNIQQRNTLFTEIRKQVKIEDYSAKIPREHWKLMNGQQLRVLADSGLVEIAAHTHNHPNLGLIRLDDATKEVTQCKNLLENVIQKEIRSIAFPDGSYTEDVKKMCLATGYKNLLAVGYFLDTDETDKSILPRYCLSSTTTTESNMIQVNRNFKFNGF